MAFQAIPGFDLDDVITPHFLEALQKWHNKGTFLFRTTAEDVQVEDTNETTITYSADNTKVHVTCTYRIKVPGVYAIAAGELLGPDKHGFHGFDQERLQIHTIFGKAGDLVPLSFTLDIFKFWCYSAFPTEADVPTLRIPGPVIGISPRVDALQIINPYLKPLSSLLVQYCEKQPSLLEGTQLAHLASASNIRTVVNAGLLSFVLRNVAFAIHADDEFSQREREYVLPLAKAIASKFGAAFGLAEHANLTLEGVEAFIQDFWQSSHEYCLAEEESLVWTGVAELAGRITRSETCGNDPRPVVLLYDMFCAAFWGILSADGATDDEVAVFKRQRAVVFGVFSELSFILSRPMSIRGFEANWSQAADGDLDSEDMSYTQWRLAGGISAEWLRSRQGRFGQWLRHSLQGDPRAQFFAGLCYDFGIGIDENKEEAVRWYRAAADQGYASAMVALGVGYDQGNGVDENKEEAVRWFRAAADLGRADAMFNLGVCYDQGDGVDEDKEEAVRWFRAAADRGNDSAAALLQRFQHEDARIALASRNQVRCGLADVPSAECLDVSAILALADATDDENISPELWTAIQTLTSEDGEPHAYAMALSILSPFLDSDSPAERWIARFELGQQAAFDGTSDAINEEGFALLIRCLGCPYRDIVLRAVFALYQLLDQESDSERVVEYATLLLSCGHYEAFPRIAKDAADSGNEELSRRALEGVRQSYPRGTEPRIHAERQIAASVLHSQPSLVREWFEHTVDAIPDSAWTESFSHYVFTGLHFNVEGGGAGVASTFFGDCEHNCFFQPVQEKCPCGRTPEALLHCLAGPGDGIYRVYAVQDEQNETVGAFTLFGDAADAEEHFAGVRASQARTQDEEEGDRDADDDALDADSAVALGSPETLRDILAGAAPLRLGELDVDGRLLFSDASRSTADRDVTVDVTVPPGGYTVICWLGLPINDPQSFLRPIALMAISRGFKKAIDGCLPRFTAQELGNLARLTWAAEGMVVASHLGDVRPQVLSANYEADTTREQTARAISWLLQLAEIDADPQVVDVLQGIDLSESDARTLLRARGIADPELSWLRNPRT